MPHRLFTMALVFTSLVAGPTVELRSVAVSAEGESNEWYQAELSRHGVKTTVDGVAMYLHECATGGPRHAAAARDLEMLGAAAFGERTAAQMRLAQTPLISARLVDAACRSTNLEIAWRADELRRREARHSDYFLVAALQLLASADRRGDLSQGDLRHASAALEKIADELLDPFLRWRLFEVLTQLSSSAQNSTVDLSPVARRADAGDAAARLALVGVELRSDRAAALRRLVTLRDHADLRIRTAVELIERTAVAPNATKVAENGRSLWQAISPLTGRRSLAGRTLVATGSHGLVVEFDAAGKTEWRHPIRAWSAEPLAGGGTLAAAFEEQRIVELNRAGEIVWEFPGIAATRAKPLPDGRIIATDFSASRIVEIDRQKNVVWSVKTPEGAFDVDRTANGHTFYGCANLIREVAPDGRVVAQWPISGRLNGLQVLADGRMLIANFGGNEVALLNRDGSVDWRLAESQPSDAFLTSDGRLFVTTARRCVEFDETREFVREWTSARYGTARR